MGTPREISVTHNGQRQYDIYEVRNIIFNTNAKLIRCLVLAQVSPVDMVLRVKTTEKCYIRCSTLRNSCLSVVKFTARMISIIICTRSEGALASVNLSISQTIGVPYEIIGIDNSKGQYGICEAYNTGASNAKYAILCFMHEDVRFHSVGWGDTVIANLRDASVGVLGLAGGSYQAKAPTGWGGTNQLFGVNVMHTVNGEMLRDYINPFGKDYMQAATLDGVWLCCRKEVWSEFKFDQVVFPGFHFYDVDFCTRVAKKYKNFILFNISLEHFSRGNFDKVWMQQAIKFYKERKNILPITTVNTTSTEKRYLNLIALHYFTIRAIDAGLAKKDVAYCLWLCYKISPINIDNMYLTKKFIASVFKSN